MSFLRSQRSPKPSEVAETLKLNPQTVRNWIDRGELTSVRLGACRVRVRQSERQVLSRRAPGRLLGKTRRSEAI